MKYRCAVCGKGVRVRERFDRAMVPYQHKNHEGQPCKGWLDEALPE